ncbi:MAG: hypothetical protein H6828_00335 [Planctomycetes bacterium]|nr:hypothetical protein [Planctomycetota bacterium]
MADPILILKTGALGDVLRTTSILPGLRATWPEAPVEWLTAPAARDLVARHPDVAAVHLVDAKDAADVERVTRELGARAWSWVISLDDEEPLCRLASALDAVRLSGAYLDAAGARAYTPDVAPWFDMGLLSVHGKQAADRMKVENERSHAAIYADMLGLPMGRPELPLPEAALAFAAQTLGARGDAWRVGLNTGAGGRWTSKQLPPERVAELAARLAAEAPRAIEFVLLGGPEERERNRDLAARLTAAGVRLVDAGVDNAMLDFAALVDALDLLVTSDSLALHVAVARRTPVVAFFAPTSAAEIELFGGGEKVRSTSADYCNYRPDADTATLTAERLVAACLRVLGAA